MVIYLFHGCLFRDKGKQQNRPDKMYAKTARSLPVALRLLLGLQCGARAFAEEFAVSHDAAATKKPFSCKNMVSKLESKTL
jgi:hypothetical protein